MYVFHSSSFNKINRAIFIFPGVQRQLGLSVKYVNRRHCREKSGSVTCILISTFKPEIILKPQDVTLALAITDTRPCCLATSREGCQWDVSPFTWMSNPSPIFSHSSTQSFFRSLKSQAFHSPNMFCLLFMQQSQLAGCTVDPKSVTVSWGLFNDKVGVPPGPMSTRFA